MCIYWIYFNQLPRLVASKATPVPVAPPPITSTSYSSVSRDFSISSRVGSGDQAYFLSASMVAAETTATCKLCSVAIFKRINLGFSLLFFNS